VAGSKQPIELAASPAGRQVEAHVEGVADTPERRKADPLEPAAFDPTDYGLRHARSGGQVPLPPAGPDPEGTDDAPDADVVHAMSMHAAAYPAITAAKLVRVVRRRMRLVDTTRVTAVRRRRSSEEARVGGRPRRRRTIS
jgi:hypothetical protein